MLAVLTPAGMALAVPPPFPPPVPPPAGQKLVLAFGDSLTAGYGLPPGQAWPERMAAALKQRGIDARFVNAGVSGDTTAGGRARLDWTLAGLPRPPDLVVLELGANDALRGQDPVGTRANLEAMLAILRARHIPVLLAGMLAPPNLGADYARAFNPIFPDLAKKHGVPLYPFFLDGVAGNLSLIQPDGLHPTEAGVAVIVDRLAPVLVRLLRTPPPKP